MSMSDNKPLKYFYLKFRRFCGFICGFIFFVPGILKLMDPVGAGLVMDSYLNFLHLGFLKFASKGLGVFFALVEVLVGTALITGVWRKITAIAAISLQGFFTLLTLILLIFNPVMDCGCFGEAIDLTHSETFVKNLIICALLAIAFIPAKNIGRPLKRKYVSFGVVCVSTIAFSIYSLLYLPLVDYTDYKSGVALTAARPEVDTTEEDAFESVFIYEKDGVQKEFTLETLPDSTWTFVNTKTVQKQNQKGTGAELSFYNENNEYQDTLATQGDVMVISIYNPDIKEKKWKESVKFAEQAKEAGFTPMILVAATPEQIKGINTNDIPVYFCDYKTLITLNRANGGATWFSQGYLIKKWAPRLYPDIEQLDEYIKGNPTETILENDSEGNLIFQGFLLYVFAVMLLL